MLKQNFPRGIQWYMRITVPMKAFFVKTTIPLPCFRKSWNNSSVEAAHYSAIPNSPSSIQDNFARVIFRRKINSAASLIQPESSWFCFADSAINHWPLGRLTYSRFRPRRAPSRQEHLFITATPDNDHPSHISLEGEHSAIKTVWLQKAHGAVLSSLSRPVNSILLPAS